MLLLGDDGINEKYLWSGIRLSELQHSLFANIIVKTKIRNRLNRYKKISAIKDFPTGALSN